MSGWIVFAKKEEWAFVKDIAKWIATGVREPVAGWESFPDEDPEYLRSWAVKLGVCDERE